MSGSLDCEVVFTVAGSIIGLSLVLSKAFWGASFKVRKQTNKTILDPQGLGQVVYSLDPEQNKVLETILNITIDFYLSKVECSMLAWSLSNVTWTGLVILCKT